MQIDPYSQQQKCSPVNVLSRDIRVMQIFTGVREIWGVKQESGRLRCRFSYLSLAIFSESSSPRLKSATHSICVKLLHMHDKLTQCCRAFTLALARLSCNISELITKYNGCKINCVLRNYNVPEQLIDRQCVTVLSYKTISTIIFTKLILIYTNNAKYKDK